MIKIQDKSKCCGCTACVRVCPRQCISMIEDKEGFLYPMVDTTQCIDCGLCEKTCPVINQSVSHKPLQIFAAYNRDEVIRKESSSGGIFTMLAEKIISEGGIVFGARFDEDFNVRHDYNETIEGLAKFRGSKYLQSRMLDCYIEAKGFLEEGRKVLFSGTPCQIAGLKHFLRKPYETLLTVDCVCHGVPSPMAWQSYLKDYDITPAEVSFRDKKESWKRYNVTISSKEGKRQSSPYPENAYMNVFLSDLSLRPSCYDCPAKAGRSKSDITLGDFWGIERISPKFDDDRGCSLLMVNTESGEKAVRALDIAKEPHTYDEAVKGNPSIVRSANIPVYRNLFMNICNKHGFAKANKLITSSALPYRLLRRLLLLLSK